MNTILERSDRTALNHEDLKWIAATSSELNSMMQQISRYAILARQHKGDYSYVDLLGERVERAARAAQSLFEKVTSGALGESTSKLGKALRSPEFSVAQSRAKVTPTTKREKGALEESQRPKTSAEKKSLTEKPASIPAEIKVLNEKGARELILIVEDEPMVAELAAAMLIDEGYRVILARDGFEALKIYQQIRKQVGLVVLDFFLPVMDGDAIFLELLALNPSVAVVLSSGFGEQSKLNSMLTKGLKGFLPKPYTREKLLAQIRTALDTPQPVGD